MNRLKTKWLWAFFSVGLFAFSLNNGSWSTSITAFIFPFCFLFILRQSSFVKGSLLMAATLMIGGLLKNPETLYLGFPYDPIYSSVVTLFTIFPFMVDRIFYPLFTKKGSVWRKFVGTLIFPAAYACFELLISLTPIGIYDSIAITQAEFTDLIQISAIIGQPGLAFLIAWFGSTLYFVIEQLLSTKNDQSFFVTLNKIKKPLAIFLSIFIIALIHGGARINTLEPKGDVAKVALSTGPEQIYHAGKWKKITLEENKEYFSRALNISSASNAELIAFNEYAFPVSYTNEENFVDFAKSAVKKAHIYSLVPVEVEDPTGFRLNQSKLYMINPEGQIEFEYTKAHLTLFLETNFYEAGKDVPVSASIPLGNNPNCTITVALGGESTIITHMNTLGNNIDINFNPMLSVNGLGAIEIYANNMRSVEHGMSNAQVDPSSQVTVFNYVGLPTNMYEVNSSRYGEVIYTYIPTHGITTIYKYAGAYIDAAFAVLLVTLSALSIVRYRKLKKTKKEENTK